MNHDQIEGRWQKLSAKVKQHWGALTDDEVTPAEGNIDELSALIQQKYGDSKQAIAKKLNDIKEHINQ